MEGNRIHELEDRTIEITQSQCKEKKDWGAGERPSGTSGTIIKDLTFVSWKSKKQRKKAGLEKYLKK